MQDINIRLHARKILIFYYSSIQKLKLAASHVSSVASTSFPESFISPLQKRTGSQERPWWNEVPSAKFSPLFIVIIRHVVVSVIQSVSVCVLCSCLFCKLEKEFNIIIKNKKNAGLKRVRVNIHTSRSDTGVLAYSKYTLKSLQSFK